MNKSRRHISLNRSSDLAEEFLRNLAQEYWIFPKNVPRDELVASSGFCKAYGPHRNSIPEIDYSDFHSYAVLLPGERPGGGVVYIEVLINKYSEHVHVHYAPYMRKKHRSPVD